MTEIDQNAIETMKTQIAQPIERNEAL